MELKIKAVSPKIGAEIPFPYYASAGAAAMDLHACIDEAVTLAPGGRAFLPTGIAIALPSAEYVALVFDRSGLGIKHGIALSNGVGVIDSDYRGEIGVGLVNLSETPYTVAPGDRIAQLAVVPVVRAALTPVEELDETARAAVRRKREYGDEDHSGLRLSPAASAFGAGGPAGLCGPGLRCGRVGPPRAHPR